MEEAQPDELFGSWFSCPEDGVATSITAHLTWNDGFPRVKYAMYKKSDGSIVGYTEEWLVSPRWDGWKTLNIVWGGTLEATDYWLVAMFSAMFCGFAYDFAEADRGGYRAQTYNSFPLFWTPRINDSHRHSIYCTYTSEAPPQYTLTLDSDKLDYWIDESIQLNGVLTLNGSPHTGLVTLYRNGVPYLETNTSPDGSYGFTDAPTDIGLLEYYTEYLVGELMFKSEPLVIRRE